MLTLLKVKINTYSKKTGQHSQWQQKCISHNKSNHPNYSYFPIYKLIMSICSCQHIPWLKIIKFVYVNKLTLIEIK